MGSAERCFIYAKACGIIAKSFVEGRISRLTSVSSPEEFAALVFPQETGTAKELLAKIERKILDKTVKEIYSVVKVFQDTPEIVVRLIRSYEYADLKNTLAAFCAGEKHAPVWTRLGRFSTVNISAYPNLPLMLKNTEYGFLLHKDLEFGKNVEGGILQAELDKHYYAALLAALRRIPQDEVQAMRKILSQEILLMNCSWALRLRAYYNMRKPAVQEHLIDEKLEKCGISLARDAISSLNMALDHHPEWENWRQKRFLNGEEPGKYWKCNPEYFQNAAAVYLYQLTCKNLRRRPFSLDTVCCFIRLKQFEEQVLNGIAEGIKLKIPADDVLKIMGGPL